MEYLYLITVHDPEGETIASGEASSANGALAEVVRIEKDLHKREQEVASGSAMTEGELGI